MRYSVIILSLISIGIPPQYSACQYPKKAAKLDIQGHRGCRGLMPENTIPAFLKALDLGVTTLELDLAVSADSQLIVSHEPWLNADICSKADGTPVKKEEAETLLILKMTADEIQKCDCGSRGNPRFLEQTKLKAAKPTIANMVAAVKKYCNEKGRPLPNFNIEIKSQPAWDIVRTPSVNAFAALFLREINALGIKEKTSVQSFDPRALEAVKKMDASVKTVLLVENEDGLEKNLARLTFKPDIYSPHFILINEETVKACHKMGIQIIPWTVNEKADIQSVIKLGVDGLITDYPDRVFKN